MAPVKFKGRRAVRLVSALAAIILGGVYLVVVPDVSAAVAGQAWLVRAWGSSLLVGGLLTLQSWFSRVLIVERLGLTFIITGLAALLAVQLTLTVGSPEASGVGGSALVVMMLSYVIARWEDVRHDEHLAKEATRERGHH